MNTIPSLFDDTSLLAALGEDLPFATLQRAYNTIAPAFDLPPLALTPESPFVRRAILHAETLLERIPDDALNESTWEHTLFQATRLACIQSWLEHHHVSSHLALLKTNTLLDT